MDRAATIAPLTPMQLAVSELLGLGLTYGELAAHLKISEDMVRTHTKRAAKKLPGDLPAQAKVMVWARGATLDVLLGGMLRCAVEARARGRRHTHTGDVSDANSSS